MGELHFLLGLGHKVIVFKWEKNCLQQTGWVFIAN